MCWMKFCENSFIAYNNLQTGPEQQLQQKEFIFAFIDMLQARATRITFRNLRSRHEKIVSTPSSPRKRCRLSPTQPQLPIKRLEPPLDGHIPTRTTKRSICKYSSYLMVLFKQKNPDDAPPRVSNVYKICGKCNVHLCDAHFQAYHQPEQDEELNFVS